MSETQQASGTPKVQITGTCDKCHKDMRTTVRLKAWISSNKGIRCYCANCRKTNYLTENQGVVR